MSAPRRNEIFKRLKRVKVELGSLAAKIVVVGGSAPATFDLGETDVRHTFDVDLVLRGSYTEWAAFQDKLRTRGFTHVIDAHVCKMVKGDLELDLMPDDEPSLAPNQWYIPAYDGRVFHKNVGLYVVRPIHFLATKLEAYASPDRDGHSDPIASHDIEDVVLVLFSSPSIRAEVEIGIAPEHRFVRHELRSQIVNHPDSLTIIQAHLYGDEASQAGAKPLLQWMTSLIVR